MGKMVLFYILFLSWTVSSDVIYNVEKELMLPRGRPLTPGAHFVLKNGILRNADTSCKPAVEKCNEFYTNRNEAENGIIVTKIGEGGQSVVYKCETNTENSDLPAVAIKLYKQPFTFNMT